MFTHRAVNGRLHLINVGGLFLTLIMLGGGAWPRLERASSVVVTFAASPAEPVMKCVGMGAMSQSNKQVIL